jgi:hypothetical protein
MLIFLDYRTVDYETRPNFPAYSFPPFQGLGLFFANYQLLMAKSCFFSITLRQAQYKMPNDIALNF